MYATAFINLLKQLSDKNIEEEEEGVNGATTTWQRPFASKRMVLLFLQPSKKFVSNDVLLLEHLVFFFHIEI